jgi:hypothetical protein
MTEIRELTEMEVDAVSGGSPLVNLTVAPQISTQLNLLVPTAVSVGGDAMNLIPGGQTNLGSQSIGSLQL